MVVQRLLMVRAADFRSRPFSLAKASSIGWSRASRAAGRATSRLQLRSSHAPSAPNAGEVVHDDDVVLLQVWNEDAGDIGLGLTCPLPDPSI